MLPSAHLNGVGVRIASFPSSKPAWRIDSFRKSLAESEEGRPLIKENAHQPNTHLTQSEERV